LQWHLIHKIIPENTPNAGTLPIRTQAYRGRPTHVITHVKETLLPVNVQ